MRATKQHSLLLVLTFALCACGAAPPPPPPERETPPPPEAAAARAVPLGQEAGEGELPEAAAARIVDHEDGTEVGGEQYGFGHWLSRDGKLIALYRWSENIRPNFGQHGEPDSPPVLELFDLRGNNMLTYDEIIATDPLRRMAVFREADDMLLLRYDEPEPQNLEERIVDPEGDENACMPPRQFSFDPLGNFVGWIRTGPDKIIVEALGDEADRGDGFDVQTPRGRLWRIELPSLPGWAVMHEVPRDTDRSRSIDWPRQNTTCVCLWCERFAASSGFHGWSGDAHKTFLTGPRGRIEVEGRVIPLAANAYGDLENGIIRRDDGSPYALPSGCDGVSFVHGMPVAIASCDGPSMIIAPGEDATVALTQLLTLPPVSLPMTDAEGHHWIAVLAGEGEKRMGRLRLEDGYLELGPTALSMAEERHYGGWTMFHTPAGAAALHVGEGRVRSLAVNGATGVSDLYIEIGRGGFVQLSPESGYAFRTSLRPSLSTADGCALTAADADGPLEQGPWRVRCPAAE